MKLCPHGKLIIDKNETITFSGSLILILLYCPANEKLRRDDTVYNNKLLTNDLSEYKLIF